MPSIPTRLTTPARPALIHVVLVEDDAGFASNLALSLQQADDLVLRAVVTTRHEASFLLEQAAPDLLLVDLGLADGGAVDLIGHASQTWPRCAIMACTTFGDEGDVLRAIEAGAHGYLLKDSNAATTLCELRNLHRGGSPISPLIARRILARLRPTPTGGALSEREMRTLECITKGYTAAEIARRMAVAPQIVLADIRHIYALLKLPVSVQASAALRGQALQAS